MQYSPMQIALINIHALNTFVFVCHCPYVLNTRPSVSNENQSTQPIAVAAICAKTKDNKTNIGAFLFFVEYPQYTTERTVVTIKANKPVLASTKKNITHDKMFADNMDSSIL